MHPNDAKLFVVLAVGLLIAIVLSAASMFQPEDGQPYTCGEFLCWTHDGCFADVCEYQLELSGTFEEAWSLAGRGTYSSASAEIRHPVAAAMLCGQPGQCRFRVRGINAEGAVWGPWGREFAWKEETKRDPHDSRAIVEEASARVQSLELPNITSLAVNLYVFVVAVSGTLSSLVIFGALSQLLRHELGACASLGGPVRFLGVRTVFLTLQLSAFAVFFLVKVMATSKYWLPFFSSLAVLLFECGVVSLAARGHDNKPIARDM